MSFVLGVLFGLCLGASGMILALAAATIAAEKAFRTLPWPLGRSRRKERNLSGLK